MIEFDWLGLLRPCFDYFPAKILPELSWTCSVLRNLAIERAPRELVDMDTVEIRTGRWLLHHNAKPDWCLLTPQFLKQRYLEINGSLPSIPPGPCRIDFEHRPTPMTWFACRHWRLPCGIPQRTMTKSLIEFYCEQQGGQENIFCRYDRPHSWNLQVDPYVATWDAEVLLVLLANTYVYDFARLLVAYIAHTSTPPELLELAFSKGGVVFEACWHLFSEDEIPLDAFPKLVRTNIDRTLAFSPSSSFLCRLALHGYMTSKFIGRLVADECHMLKTAVARGCELSDALLGKLLEREDVYLHEWLKTQVGDNRYLQNIPVHNYARPRNTARRTSLNVSNLTPESALIAIRIYGDLPLENEHIQTLLSIAAKRKKKEAGGTKKRRKFDS